MTYPNLRFSRADQADFFRTLNNRVNEYFQQNDIKKYGNWKLYLKSAVVFAFLLTPYFLILSNNFNQWVMLLLTVMIGTGASFVGMCVMHDGNHGSFSSRQWVNNLMGSSIYFLAGNVYNWKVQHNILHHTYTNIIEHDDDIRTDGLIRLHKEDKWRRFHKYQHYYSIFLYGLLTLNWVLRKDYRQMRDYMQQGFNFGKKINVTRQWTILILTKAIYALIWIVIPILILNIAWWKVMIGFVVMHYTSGIILSVVFQLAHIVEDAQMPAPAEGGTMENTWAIHQLCTTANFAPKNKLVSWFVGGLNFQIEHHIFPHISHVHYPKISKIVKATALEFGLPYIEYSTTRKAILSHFRMLRELGRGPALAAGA
ncbi:MAG: acyl-CoA desaturase [Lewinellaceae bacterium]|nr:acyl-CoA desaturase [Saprospiraceae bacterium]MCB9338168.1 acyl-CoA desaturase [Lewinellaceae bacterium]